MLQTEQPVCLLSIGTAVPQGMVSQEEFIQLQKGAAEYAIQKLNPQKDKERIQSITKNCEWVIKCAKHSMIHKRHVIVSSTEPNSKIQTIIDVYKAHDYNPPYTVRAQYWRKYCPELAMKAVNKALTIWGGNKDRITHVVSHSITGWDVPGISHHVIYNLQLSTDTRAIPVNFVGCHGGAQVIYVATQLAKQNPNAVVLAISAEIQSPLARLYNDDISLDRSLYIPNVLFGDGAACAIIGRPDIDHNINKNINSQFAIFELGKMGSYCCPNSRNVLTVSVSEEKGVYFENAIKKELPVHINNALGKHFIQWHEKVLPDCQNPNDCAYAMHPGGPRILNNIETLLRDFGVVNSTSSLKYSYENLREYGNLASASIFFVLDKVCRNTDKDFIYYMAMGPGISIEYGGMIRYNPNKQQISVRQSIMAGSIFLFVVVGLGFAFIFG